MQTQLAEGLPLIQGDRVQVQQVILNMIINAIEAMGGIGKRSGALLVSSEQEASGDVLVSVQDSGPGVDPKQLDSIFTAFVTTKLNGMGLGLAICRMIMEHHGGELTASSDGKNGTLFQFVLPIGLADKGSSM